MNNNIKRIARFGAIILTLFLAIGLPAVTALATSIQDAKDEKSRLEKKQQQIEETMRELEGKKSDIVSYIETLDRKQQELETGIEKLNGEMEDAQAELDQTKLDLEDAKETVADQYSIMKKRIKYMYENGNSDYIEIFLNSESMADLLNQAEYMTKIAEYDNELLGRYEEVQLFVEEKEKQLENQIVNLEMLTEELRLEMEANEQLAADKKAQVEKYNRLIDEAGNELDQYNAAIEAQQDTIDKLIEQERKRKEEEERRKQQQQQQEHNAASEAAGKALLNGGFIWPLPSSTRITSGFGGRAEVMAGSGTYHYGVDIGTPYGNNILAAAAGTVVQASYHWSMGNYVLIDHGSDIYTVYMHSSKLLVSAGEHVDQGDVVALVGSTGMSTGPHLHFGLKVNGSYVNPLNYVSY